MALAQRHLTRRCCSHFRRDAQKKARPLAQEAALVILYRKEVYLLTLAECHATRRQLSRLAGRTEGGTLPAAGGWTCFIA